MHNTTRTFKDILYCLTTFSLWSDARALDCVCHSCNAHIKYLLWLQFKSSSFRTMTQFYQFYLFTAPQFDLIWFKNKYHDLSAVFSLDFYLLGLGVTAYLCRVPAVQKYSENLTDKLFPFARIFKINKTDKMSGSDFKCWICICHLFDCSYKYKIQGDINASGEGRKKTT